MPNTVEKVAVKTRDTVTQEALDIQAMGMLEALERKIGSIFAHFCVSGTTECVWWRWWGLRNGPAIAVIVVWRSARRQARWSKRFLGDRGRHLDERF